MCNQVRLEREDEHREKAGLGVVDLAPEQEDEDAKHARKSEKRHPRNQKQVSAIFAIRLPEIAGEGHLPLILPRGRIERNLRTGKDYGGTGKRFSQRRMYCALPKVARSDVRSPRRDVNVLVAC